MEKKNQGAKHYDVCPLNNTNQPFEKGVVSKSLFKDNSAKTYSSFCDSNSRPPGPFPPPTSSGPWRSRRFETDATLLTANNATKWRFWAHLGFQNTDAPFNLVTVSNSNISKLLQLRRFQEDAPLFRTLLIQISWNFHSFVGSRKIDRYSDSSTAASAKAE